MALAESLCPISQCTDHPETSPTHPSPTNLMAAESSINCEIFNVGTGNPQSVNHLADLIGGDTVNIQKRPGEPDSTHADISKIKKMLGWKPTISFEDGVKIMLDNIDYWKDAPLWTVDEIEKATKTWFKYLSEEEVLI